MEKVLASRVKEIKESEFQSASNYLATFRKVSPSNTPTQDSSQNPDSYHH